MDPDAIMQVGFALHVVMEMGLPFGLLDSYLGKNGPLALILEIFGPETLFGK